MQRTIKRVEFPVPVQPKATRVAAYARVSTGKDAMLHSLSAQVSHYSKMIQSHPGWLYCGVYADEAFTGTKEDRAGFQKLLAECRAGNIDLIITKSISRFARNTVTLLSIVRELKLLGVDVFFEEQNIHTMSGDGELMMTILASYAQEESLSASENQKWRVRRNFEAGIPWKAYMIGYHLRDGRYEIVPEEASLVRRIFDEYLGGKGYEGIAKMLNAEGIPSYFGRRWGTSEVERILKNKAYTGDLILQSTFRENHLTKRKMINEGQLPKYFVEESHEPIIDKATFQAVQEERERRAKRFLKKPFKLNTYPFTRLLICEKCGRHYKRKVTPTGPVWICITYETQGKAQCAAKAIPEDTLHAVTATVLGTDRISDVLVRESIESILVGSQNRLTYRMKDGRVVEQKWKDRSRSQSWTPEMKEAARQKALERRK